MKQYELQVMYEYYKHQMEHGDYSKEYYRGKMDAIYFVIEHINVDKPNIDFYIDFLKRITNLEKEK